MKLKWDQPGERLFHTGVDHAILFPYTEDGYGAGVAWNGLTAVNEANTGGEPNPVYADNTKYLNLMSREEYQATIEAYMYPKAFAPCNGYREVAKGGYITQQKRQMFGLVYRTLVGNDTDDIDHGYIWHFVYGCVASPSDKSHSTVNETPDPETMSWEITTTPVEIGPGFRPTAHFEVHSLETDDEDLAALETIIYGTDTAGSVTGTDSRLPLPAEIISTLGTVSGT